MSGKNDFEFGSGEIVVGSDFTFMIPDHYHAIKDLDGKEVIACAKDCKEEYILSPLNVILGRQALPGEVSPEMFTLAMIKTAEMHVKMSGGGSVDSIKINGVPAVVIYTDNIVYVSIYHIVEYYQLRITFNTDFNNKNEIAQKIFNSFLITDMTEEGTDTSYLQRDEDSVQTSENQETFLNPAGRALSCRKAISAGFDHSMVLLENGDVYSFGNGEYGQLGHGDNVNRLLPTKIELLSEVKAISTGNFYSLVLLETGDVYSFGLGKHGQLGHGDSENRLLPTKIETLAGVKAISAGGQHSLVLLENGDVYSFGHGNRGRLGHGDEKDRIVPTKIESLTDAKAISAGNMHSLVLLENGDVYSFGGGDSFRLGLGDIKKRLVPTKIEGLTGVKGISSGNSHSLVLLENGDVYSFGDGRNGALGHGNEKKYREPTKVAGIAGASAVAAGDWVSLMLLENGQVYSCGSSAFGALGYRDYENQLIPKKIEDLSYATAISTGLWYSMVILNNGDVYSFGKGSGGRLGHGDEENRDIPTKIEGLPKAAGKGYSQSHRSLLFSEIPLVEISAADFEDSGRILTSISPHIDEALIDLSVRTPVMECRIANELFVNLVNIIDFANYRDHIVSKVAGNQAGMTMKGLFLYTIRSFFWTMREYNQSPKVRNYFIVLFNNMLNYYFCPDETISDEIKLNAFGTFGLKYREELLALFNNSKSHGDDNLLGAKLSFIYDSVRAVLAEGKEELAVCGGKINAIRLLQYLSDDVVYFKPDNVIFEGSKRVMQGLEANAEYFWNHPEIILDFESFGNGLSDLINYLEHDITYTYSLSEIDEDGHQFFKYEDVTGFSFLNLFATEAAGFSRAGEDAYEVYLDIELELSHSEFKERIAGLIYDLGKYNDHYIDSNAISFTNTKNYTKSITDDFSLTLEEMGLSLEDLSRQRNDEEMTDSNSVKVPEEYQVAFPPDHISAFHRQNYMSGLSTISFQKMSSGLINIQVNRGVELSMEAVKTGIYTPPYDNKKFAWEYARVFRVDDNAFKGSYDREAEIQQPYIRSVTFLSALRSFAWTLQGYLEKANRGIEDVSIEEMQNIADFIEQRSLLNYTNDSHFPALCGVADFGSAYIPLSVTDPCFVKTCRLTECKSCGDLFGLRSELTTLTPIMAKIRDNIFENRINTTEQLTGTLSDILYAWCALSLAADGAFRIVDGTLSYYLDVEKGGVENFSLPYWEGDEDDKAPLVQLMDDISRLPKADINGTYFEAELVGTGYEGRSDRIELINVGDQVKLKRNPDNPYDSNAVEVLNSSGESLGHISKEFAAVLAPGLDQGLVSIKSAEVLSVTPLSQRSQRAKNPLLTVAVRLDYYG